MAGILKVRRDGDKIVMDFPVYPAEAPPAHIESLVQTLAVAASGGKAVQEVLLERNNCYLLVQLEDMTRFVVILSYQHLHHVISVTNSINDKFNTISTALKRHNL